MLCNGQVLFANHNIIKIIPCKNVQMTSYTVTVLWWLLVIPSREQATVPLTIPVTEREFSQLSQDCSMGTPPHIWGRILVEQPSKGWGTQPPRLKPPATLFSWKDGPPSSPTSTVGGWLPSCPPLPETVQAAEPLPGGQERVGNGFVSDASAQWPQAQNREGVVLKPSSQNRTCREKEKQANEGKTLLRKNTQRLK